MRGEGEVELDRLRGRLLDGQPLRLAALGGSSTAGHQLPRDSPLLYYNRLAGWINESHPHVETLVVNSGTPASGPTYMEKCPPECAQRVGPRMHDGEISSLSACSPFAHSRSRRLAAPLAGRSAHLQYHYLSIASHTVPSL